MGAIIYLTQEGCKREDGGEGEWRERAGFWNPGRPLDSLPPIAMINLTCDESNDGRTYALAGWFASPDAWDCITKKWEAMLTKHKAPEFHAAEIVERDRISDSRFKGWTREQEVAIFTEAADIITKKECEGWLMSIGFAISVPDIKKYPSITDDTIWFILFCRLLHTLIIEVPNTHGIDLLFDEKKEVRQIVDYYFYQAREAAHKFFPGRFANPKVAFGSSIETPPIQAADFLAFEWRRRISRRERESNAKERLSFTRLKERRHWLRYYGADSMEAIRRDVERGKPLFEAIWEHPATDEK